VYGFVGATLGPRAGVISGWALMGTYTFYGVVTATAAGIFGADFFDALGIWTNQPGWAPFMVGALALVGVWALAASNIREGTRVLLVIEGTTVALILIVSVVILIRLATGTAPNGNTLDFSVFSVPDGPGTPDVPLHHPRFLPTAEAVGAVARAQAVAFAAAATSLDQVLQPWARS
jgi:L-asparagine transporter-like permease